VYSFLGAVKRVREGWEESVFLAMGFETTTPAVASLLAAGEVEGPARDKRPQATPR